MKFNTVKYSGFVRYGKLPSSSYTSKSYLFIFFNQTNFFHKTSEHILREIQFNLHIL